MSPDQLAELGKQGLLAFLLAMAIGAIIYLYRNCQKVQTERVADWKEIRKTLDGNTLSMQELRVSNEPRIRALEGNVRALELMTGAVTQLSNELSQLREIVGEAMQSNRSVREALIKRGLEL